MTESTETPAAPRSRSALWLGCLALWLGYAVVLGLRLGDAPIDSHAEQRCADIVQEMHASGDWLVPRRDGGLWLNKPPLFYWAATTAGALVGRDDLLVLRGVSALAALAVLALVIVWVARERGLAAGLLSGALFTLMVEVVSRGREGTAEMLLCLLTNVCLFVHARYELGGRRSAGLRWVFAGVLALAILAKATSALLVVGLPVFVHLVMRRRLRAAFRPAAMLPVVLAIVAGFSWHIVLSLGTPGAWDIFRNALLVPLGIQTEMQAVLHSATHYEPWYTQVDAFFRGALPASLLLPLVLIQAVRTRFWRDSASLRFHAIVVVSLVIAFALLPQKRPHYLLPTFPSFAILIGDACMRQFARGEKSARRLFHFASGMTLVLLLASVVGLGFWFGLVLQRPTLELGLLGVLAVGAIVLALLATRRRWPATLMCVGLLAWWAPLTTQTASAEIWRRQFRDGSVVERPDYDAQHWDALRERYPRVLKVFDFRDDDPDVGSEDDLDAGLPEPAHARATHRVATDPAPPRTLPDVGSLDG